MSDLNENILEGIDKSTCVSTEVVVLVVKEHYLIVMDLIRRMVSAFVRGLM